jgi:hypothetical protein
MSDVDVLNEAVRALCLAIPPRAAAQLALATAGAIDRKLGSLSPLQKALVHRKDTKSAKNLDIKLGVRLSPLGDGVACPRGFPGVAVQIRVLSVES